MVQKVSSLSVENLLNALSQFLDSDGGIKNLDGCVKFSNCMKQVGKGMMSVCTYLNVIRATHDEKVLSKLLLVGAWQTLYEWLVEYKDMDDLALLLELLQTFNMLPVTMELLKATKSAKVIKSLMKHSNEDVKTLAQKTVEKWMSLIKSNSSSTVNGGSSSSKDKKKKKNKTAVSDKPQTPVETEGDDSLDTDVPSPPPQPIFKESSSQKSVGLASQTAKQHTVKERSAGVEAGVIKPKPRGSKPTKAASNTTKKSNDSSSGLSTSNKRVVSEPTSHDSIESKKAKLSLDKEEDLGRVKVIPARPKPAHIVQDSDGFMAALMQPRAPTVSRKKKIATTPPNSKIPTSPTEKGSPTSPTSPIVAPPSFYKDTLEGPPGASPTYSTSLSPDPSDRLSPVQEPMEVNGSSQDGESKPKKKTVRWREDKDLREYFYFELLEDERVNVNRIRDQQDFNDLKKKEMLSDREAVKGLHATPDGITQHSKAPPPVTENFPWKIPAVIADIPERKAAVGSKSVEKHVQAAREIGVLAALYFNKAMMPASASEPDKEEDMLPSNTDIVPVIPLEQPLAPAAAAAAAEEPVVTEPSVDNLASNTATVSDFIPGVTADSIDLLHRLANGEAGQELIEVLANTDPEYVNQLIRSESLAADENEAYEHSTPYNNNQQHYHPYNNRGRNYNGPQRVFNYNGARGGGPRPYFRGGGRGGRGRARGSGPPNRGPSQECYHFMKLGRCDFGNACKFTHSEPGR